MKQILLIKNAYWRSASMDRMEARLCAAFERLGARMTAATNGSLPLSVGLGPFDPPRPDAVLFWDKDTALAEAFQARGIPVFNPPSAIALCDDKALTHLRLDGIVPMPATLICPMTFPGVGYPDKAFLDRAEAAFGYPMVLKEACGSLGTGVHLCRTRAEAEALLDRLAGSRLLLQAFVAASAGRDKRLYMVGGRCAGAILRTNPLDFRANLALGGSAEAYEPTPEETEICRRASDALGLAFSGVDLLDGPGGPLLCEVNSNAHFTGLEKATGRDIAGEIAREVLRRAGEAAGEFRERRP